MTHAIFDSTLDGQIHALMEFMVRQGVLAPQVAAQAASNRNFAEAFSAEFHLVQDLRELPAIEFDQVHESDIIVVLADTETTGNTPKDEIIELGLIELAVNSSTGTTRGILDSFNARREPSVPISPAAQAVHHIAIEDLRGLSFSAEDHQRIRQIVADSRVIIAHNASYDRPYCEKLDPTFEQAAWACSLKEIDWRTAGYGSSKLEFLAISQGIKYKAHSAYDDCTALARVLEHPLSTGTNGMLTLTSHVGDPSAGLSHRIWAINAPFSAKATLKANGYEWSGGEIPGTEKAWYKEVDASALQEELEWLRTEAYKVPSFAVIVDDVTPISRYSTRRINTRRITHSSHTPVRRSTHPRA